MLFPNVLSMQDLLQGYNQIGTAPVRNSSPGFACVSQHTKPVSSTSSVLSSLFFPKHEHFLLASCWPSCYKVYIALALIRDTWPALASLVAMGLGLKKTNFQDSPATSENHPWPFLQISVPPLAQGYPWSKGPPEPTHSAATKSLSDT